MMRSQTVAQKTAIGPQTDAENLAVGNDRRFRVPSGWLWPDHGRSAGVSCKLGAGRRVEESLMRRFLIVVEKTGSNFSAYVEVAS